jgi:predicted small metal-binding protein
MSADSDAACAQYKKKWARPSCFECRKSKRRCDSLLPKCSRCESLGLDCEYKIAAETKAETVRPTVAAAHTPAAQQPPSDAPQDDAGVLWISSTLLLDSSSVRRLLYQGMRAIDWPEWLNSQNDAQLEHTIFKLHDPELPVISLLQMIVLIKGVSAAFPVPKLTIASCVRVCNSLVQSIEQEMRALPSRISARMCSKNRSFETAAGLVPWMTVLLTESGILGDALSSLHTRLLRLSNTVVCFFFAKPIDAKVSPLTSSAKRSRTAQLGPDADDSVTCATSASISDASFFTSNPFTALTNALSRPWAVLSRMATTVVSQASDQYRLAISVCTPLIIHSSDYKCPGSSCAHALFRT